MKRLAVLLLLNFASCGDPKPSSPPVAAGPVQPVYQPGEIIAHFDEAIAEDTLNDRHFTIDIVADSLSNETGKFGMTASFGGLTNFGRFTLPGSMVAQPVLRKDSSMDYQMIAGFITLQDSQFHELYRISGSDTAVRILQTKRYVPR